MLLKLPRAVQHVVLEQNSLSPVPFQDIKMDVEHEFYHDDEVRKQCYKFLK